MSLQMHYPDSPSSELYTGGDEEEHSVVVAVNVVGTVSGPLLSKTMVSELLRAYKADNNNRKDFESQVYSRNR
jgi:hypothetical protein